MKKRHAFLLGAVVGGVGALLLTPKSGKELQAELLEKTEELKTRVKDFDAESFVASSMDELEKIKQSISNFDWEASKEEIKDKVQELTARLDQLKTVVEDHATETTVKLSQDDILEDIEMLETLQELEDLEELDASEK